MYKDPAPLLGNDRTEYPREDVLFAFGPQPVATREAGRKIGETVGVVGVGDAFFKFGLPALQQRGSRVYLYDPKFESAEHAASLSYLDHDPALKASARKLLNATDWHYVPSISDMPQDTSHVLIMSPPKFHTQNLNDVMEQRPGMPIMMEKPIVANRGQIAEMKETIRKAPLPRYAIDWQIPHVFPLLLAAFQGDNIRPPFSDGIISEENRDGISRLDLTKAFRISASFVEDGINPLAVLKGREWMSSYLEGGGSFNDQGIHFMNALAAMGFQQTGIKYVELGRPLKGQQGLYRTFGKEAGTLGELYGYAETLMEVAGGQQEIEAQLECGKFGYTNDGKIVIEQTDGITASWEMFPEAGGSSLIVTDATGEQLARLVQPSDCYALGFEEAAQYFNLWRQDPSQEPVAYYAHEQLKGMEAVCDIHEHARSKEKSSTTVKQKALERLELAL